MKNQFKVDRFVQLNKKTCHTVYEIPERIYVKMLVTSRRFQAIKTDSPPGLMNLIELKLNNRTS